MENTDEIKEVLLKLQRAVESSGEAIFITNLDGLITYINPGFTDLYGFTADEVIGKTTPRILRSGMTTPEAYKSFWAKLLNKEVVRGEFINRSKDGSFITVEGSANPILNDHQEIIGFIGVQHDISSKKRSEESLRQSEEKFRKVFMTSPDSVIISRLSDGMYVSVNEGFTKILGYSEEEVIGKTSIDLEIWVDKQKRKDLLKELQEKGRVDSFEVPFRKKDGSFVIGFMSASLIDIEGVPHIISATKDITRRKQIGEALVRERYFIDALMNNLTDYIYIKDRESRFLRINKSHSMALGLDDPDQVIGKTDRDFYLNEHADIAFDDEKLIVETGQTISNEEKLTLDGRPDMWVFTTKMPLLDHEGNIVGTFGISRDITEKKKSEEALKQSEERFRSVAQSANDAIITTDSKGNILGWNRGAENIFGYTESEIIGQSLNLIIPKDYFELHNSGMQRMETGGEKHVIGKTVELHGLKKNENIFPLELSLSEWETSDGIFFTAIIRDITTRKRTELENQIIYELTQGVTTTSNLDELLKLMHLSLRKVVYAENCFVALHNQKTGHFSFPYFVDKIDTIPPMSTSMEKSCTAYVFRTGKPFLFEQDLFDKLKEQNEVELIGSPSPSWIGIPLQTPSKVIGVLVLQNYEKENVYSESDVKFLVSIGSQIAISIERKKAEEEIKLKNELLQAINAEKDKFFSILAHDLRGPLSAFVAGTQIITEEIQTMSLKEIKDITGSMKTSATNIYNLLENLLEWSRLKRGRMDFIPVKLNLKKKIIACTDVLSESARKKQLEIVISIPDELEVFADNHMFDTIIRNLVSNAIKFTITGGKVTVEAGYNNDRSIEIKIIDTGIGMTPELKSKLFLINEKTSRNGTEGEPSTGLGLLLVKEFIEKHGGKIWVESEVGKGSTFVFTIGPVENLKIM